MTIIDPIRPPIIAPTRGPLASGALPWEAGGGAVPWTPAQLASLGGLEAWYRGDQLAAGTLADLGPGGHDLPTLAGTVTTTTRAGQTAMVFGGAAALQGAFGHTHAQPITIYSVFETSSLTTSGFYDGNDVTNRCASFVNTSLRAYAGATLIDGVLSTGTIYGAAVVYNGASSAIYNLDFATATTTGNAGATGLDGFTIGALYNGGNKLTGYIWEIVVCTGAHNAATRKLVGDYFTARYTGLTVVT